MDELFMVVVVVLCYKRKWNRNYSCTVSCSVEQKYSQTFMHCFNGREALKRLSSMLPCPTGLWIRPNSRWGESCWITSLEFSFIYGLLWRDWLFNIHLFSLLSNSLADHFFLALQSYVFQTCSLFHHSNVDWLW